MREYSINSGNVTLALGTGVQIYIKPAAGPSVNLEFLRFWAGQNSSTTSAQLRAAIGLASGSATVTAFTPIKLKEQDSVSVIIGSTNGSAGTTGTNASVDPGTKTAQLEYAFNVLNGMLEIPTPPETRIQPAGATSGLIFFFPVAPSPLTGWTYGLNFREV